MSLRKTSLSNVCEITMGQAPDGETYNSEGVGLPLIAGAGDFGAMTPIPTKFTSAPTKISAVGDIILCIRATIGDRNWSDKAYCLGRGVAGLRADAAQLDQRYLWHWIGNTTPELKAKGRGATFLQVSKSDIGSLDIPLPPLPEQRRIAAILDKADALRAKRREVIAKLDQLLQSVFLDMFGDPMTNPKGWPTSFLGEISDFENGDRSANYPSDGDMTTSGVLFLSTKNIVKNKLDLRKVQFISQHKFDSLSRGKLRKGDLIITLRGTLGACGIFESPYETGFINAQMMIIRPHSHLRSDFLHYLLTSPSIQSELQRTATGAAVQQLTSRGLANLTIYLPPRDLQDLFVCQLKRVRSVQQKEIESAHGLERLISSCQCEAFQAS